MRLRRIVAPLALIFALGCGDTPAADPTPSDESGDTQPSASGESSSTDTAGQSESSGDGPDATTTSGPAPGETETSDAESSSGEPPLGDPVTIAVGYGGMRVRSLDEGHSWQDYVQEAANGGDDMDLLRGAAWGEGRFVAVGWRLYSSPDGAAWTEHENPTGQWYGAVAYGNDQFLAVGGGGYCARSDDGEQWEACTDATDDGGFTHVRSVLFFDERFWTADQSGVLRSSPAGDVWTVEDPAFGTPWAAIVEGSIVPVEESAAAEFATKRLRGAFAVGIERAEPDTEDWAPVFAIPDSNSVFQAYRFAFAEGWVR